MRWGAGAAAPALPASSGQQLDAAPFNAVHLVAHAAKLVPGWLTRTPALVEALRARWNRCGVCS